MTAGELFGDDVKLGETLDAVNEALLIKLVQEGKADPQTLDHLGHVKHNIYNPACPYCKGPAS